MFLIEKQNFVQGINFRMGITYGQLKQLMDSNAQYIIELSKEFKM